MKCLKECIFKWKKNEILLRLEKNIYCKRRSCWNELEKELAFAPFSVQRIAEKEKKIPDY